MKNVPHWQGLVLLYFIVVGVPVYLVHTALRKRAYANPTFINLALYFIGVMGSAFALHSLCMWIYFTFFFTVRN